MAYDMKSKVEKAQELVVLYERIGEILTELSEDTDLPSHSGDSEAPKKRGRPPKNPNAVMVAPKAAVEGEAPKKRGRPRKNPLEISASTDAPPAEKKKRGRPRKNPLPDANAEPAAPKKRGRPPKNPNAVPNTDADKQPKLPDLLVQLGQQFSSKDLSVPDFVKLAREAGYKSDAKDFSNMVYQALGKLVKNGVFSKDTEKVEGTIVYTINAA